jgi:hypothetical protein
LLVNRSLALPIAALALLSVTACLGERTYMDPYANGTGLFAPTSPGAAFVRGDVGELTGIDNGSEDLWVTRERGAIAFAGNVPYQRRPGSSVYLDIRIANPEQLPVGQELRQEGLADTFGAEPTDGPVLGVYVCPNGEGISGDADDIVVTRTGPDTFTFRAVSSLPEQNLDVDLDLATLEPER